MSAERRKTAMPTLLVSGASGTLGQAFIAAARERWRDASIICLVRSDAAATEILAAAGTHRDNISFAKADLTDERSVADAALTIGRLGRVVGVHAAADVSWDRTTEELTALNVHGASHFYDLLAMVATEPRMVYLSTAYANGTQWAHRNGYEETKTQAEALLRAKSVRMPLSVFACSLVVGDSQTGAIARYSGVYPMLRFLAELQPPFLVGRKTGLLDLVPLDWVTEELVLLCDEQMRGAPPRDVVAAAGRNNGMSLERTVRLAEERINLFRRRHGLAPMQPTPILRGRQWAFLQRSLKAWQPTQLKLSEFRYFERLMEIYGAYSESDDVRPSAGIRHGAINAEEFMPIVFDDWLETHADRLLSRQRRPVGTKRSVNEQTA